jgi:thioredoxin-like negative regulator of GroEL
MIDELKLGYTVLDDYQLVAAQDYQVRALPTVLLVDAGGTIRHQGHALPSAEQIRAALP